MSKDGTIINSTVKEKSFLGKKESYLVLEVKYEGASARFLVFLVRPWLAFTKYTSLP
jgi:hypothetical protein